MNLKPQKNRLYEIMPVHCASLWMISLENFKLMQTRFSKGPTYLTCLTYPLVTFMVFTLLMMLSLFLIPCPGQCWKFPQVRWSEADNFGGGLGTFCWFFLNFMFMNCDSRHKDLQLFWLSFKHWSRVRCIWISLLVQKLKSFIFQWCFNDVWPCHFTLPVALILNCWTWPLPWTWIFKVNHEMDISHECLVHFTQTKMVWIA